MAIIVHLKWSIEKSKKNGEQKMFGFLRTNGASTRHRTIFYRLILSKSARTAHQTGPLAPRYYACVLSWPRWGSFKRIFENPNDLTFLVMFCGLWKNGGAFARGQFTGKKFIFSRLPKSPLAPILMAIISLAYAHRLAITRILFNSGSFIIWWWPIKHCYHGQMNTIWIIYGLVHVHRP